MKGKKVIVAGAGKSGVSSVGLLLRNGADVILFDQNEALDKEALFSNFGNPDRVELVLGSMTPEKIREASLMVISPGIALDAPFVNRVRDAGVTIWGEIELAAHFNRGRIAAITGTNGKTTTTTLVGEIFKAFRKDSLVVGNIGTPFTQFADSTQPNQLVAAEISSFQLETIQDFHPEVSAVLNLTPDHLNRHHTFENYADAKMRIAENQTQDNFCVMNYDDPEVRKRAEALTNVQVVYFSRLSELKTGVYIRDDNIVIREPEHETTVLPVSDIRILGTHNVENVLAAVAIAYKMGIPLSVIRDTVETFQGVEHRIEFVRKVGGVEYYNDSKGTNPDAAIKAIQAMKAPTLLIGGGYNKNSTYDEWIEAFEGKVRYLVLMGETAQAISDCAKRHGFNQVVFVDSLEEAVKFCAEHARPGDAVLLSPACASWDLFKSYEERGTKFKEYVKQLED